MDVTDWEKWMSDHHIKLRGTENDSRSNEKCTGTDIFRTDVAAESRRNEQPAGRRDL